MRMDSAEARESGRETRPSRKAPPARVLVYYCQSLVRELDLGNQRSTIVDRWLSDESSQPKL
jgi:hypothetical protein